MATSYFRNTNSHGVAAPGDRRRPAGAVFSVDEDAAKLYAGIPGVEKASKSDYDDSQSANAGASSEVTGDMVALDAAGDLRIAHRRMLVSAPLQRVIGDDQAPYGPPTGTLSTKVAEAEKDLAHRLAFADHEALGKVEVPEEESTFAGVPKGQVIHNEQAEAKAAVNEVAEELNEVHGQPVSAESEAEAKDPGASPEKNKKD